jgi:hypothetical protein
MTQFSLFDALSASLWEERIGTDISLLYNINIKKWFEISIGSGIGEGLIWESYYLQFADQSTNETDKKTASFWGMSPYFKGSLFINREIENHFGIRFGIDFIYSETNISNADYTLDKFPALDIYINAMTKSYEHRFAFRFGITYAI